MPVTIEHSPPPPYADGTDWTAYFRARRERRLEEARLAAEKQALRSREPYETLERAHEISILDLPSAAKTLAGRLEKLGYEVVPTVFRLHYHEVLYVGDSTGDEDDSNEHSAGDVRYEAYDASYYTVMGSLIDAEGEVAVALEARYFERPDKDGKLGAAFEMAKAGVRGLGVEIYLKAKEFTEWQRIMKIAPPAKPKVDKEQQLMGGGEWNG